MLIAAPLSAVIMGVVMFSLANATFDGLVADDYYKRGLEIDRVLQRTERARALGVSARLSIDSGGDVRVQIVGTVNTPQTIGLSFAHATARARDLRAVLEHRGANLYTGKLTTTSHGYGDLQLETKNWRLDARKLAPLRGKTFVLYPGD